MNNKAFTIIELLSAIIIISIIMALVFPAAFNVRKKNKTRIYTEYENMMVEYARISPLNKEDIIDLADLEELDRVKRECIGYVTIDHESEPNEYKAYISCGDDYETEGFNQEFKTSKGNGGNGSDGPIYKLYFLNRDFVTDYSIYQQMMANGQYEYTPGFRETVPYNILLYAGDSGTVGIPTVGIPLIYTGDKEIYCKVGADDPYADENGRSKYVKCNVTYSTSEHKEIIIYSNDGEPETGLVRFYAEEDGVYDFDFNFRYEMVKRVPSITVSNEYSITDSYDKISFSVTTDKGLSLSVNNNKCSVVYQNDGYNTVLCQGLPRGNNTLTFSTAENREYKAGSVTKTFNLPYENGFINITASDDNVPCNGTKIYTISHHGGTLSCTTSNPSVATCSVNGNYVTVNGISSGYFKLTVTSSQTSTYNSASKEIDQYVDSCATWHYKTNLPLLCSNMCSSLCSESSSNTWSCTSSDTTPPSGVSQNTGSRCWCYY